MKRARHSKKGAHQRLTRRLALASSTLVVTALVIALGTSVVNTGMPTMQDAASTSIPTADMPYDAEEADTTSEQTTYAELDQEEYVPNTVLVSVSGPDEVEAVSAQVSQSGLVPNASLDASDAEFGFVKFAYEGSLSSGELADQLRARGIEAQPNFLYYALDLEDAAEEPVEAQTHDAGQEDGALEAQAAIINDPNRHDQWALTSVKAYDAWDIAKSQDRAGEAHKVTVAVVDSGINVNHPDLKNNIVGTWDTRTGGADVADEQDHGTAVAGIIAAEANNNTGVAGVSYNAGLYIVRALHRQGSTFVAESSDVIKAYDNIIASRDLSQAGGGHIRVVNMSLGSKRTGALSASDQAVMRKIDEAYASYDILTVSAAGNRDGSVPYNCYPCDFSDNVIGVINLQQNANDTLTRNEDSNFNMPGARTKQLSAPGTRILSTNTRGGYSYKTGTSMAAPLVSGIAALAFAANPQLSAESVKTILCDGCDDINQGGFDVFTGYGKINAYKVAQRASGNVRISGADSVYVGKTISLSCPGSTTWSSSNESIATISGGGAVKGIKAGSVTITATVDGKTLKKMVTVYDGVINGPGTVASGDTAQYTVKGSIDGTWEFVVTENPTVAEITQDGMLTAIKPGTVRIAARLSSNHDVSTEVLISVSQGPVDDPGNVADQQGTSTTMHRLYNPNSGEHFYTAATNERDSLVGVGWTYEGTGWTAPSTSGTPVYRLYNANAGDHHYTLDANERDTLVGVGWAYEGIGWYSDDSQRVALYRQYNPNALAGSHNYTTSAHERDTLVGAGWVDEGIGWYGL